MGKIQCQIQIRKNNDRVFKKGILRSVLLCKKLKIYPQSPEKIEIYAQATRLFFMLGNKATFTKKPLVVGKRFGWFLFYVSQKL
ncbi:hypothetical protein [Campylobacter majalis]|uniref:hypothetical protein n=1 Tax=Campylobacter majalis TaxID=2790656 RepID=UPI001E56C17E|nr:hypothetical protein [Campylobacter majalis]